jgi:hypothetical protein
MKTIQENAREKIAGKLKTGVCALALTSVMLTPVAGVCAGNDNVTSAIKDGMSKSNTQAEKSTQEKTAEKRKEIVSEAVAALNDTREALKALDDKDTQKALSVLQGVTGKLEIILARDPGLTLVPAGVNAVSYSIIGSPDDIEKLKQQAKDLLNDGKIQEARHVLQNLASETDINTTNIPLATYPAAIKQAAKLIDDGKTEDAKIVLQTALNTVVITQTIVPLPIAAAQVQLKEAEKLAEKKERKDDENKHLSQLLDGAQGAIKLAQELGYGQKKDFDSFYEEIDKIRNKTSDGKSGSGFFETIKGYITTMSDNSQTAKDADIP